MTATSRSGELRARLDPYLSAWLPVPGRGHTGDRFAALFECGRADLEVARLAEAHHDARAIAAELDRELHPDAVYGVWAASGPDPLTVVRSDRGLAITGSVPWCTGVGIVDRALVTAKTSTSDAPILLDIAINDGSVVDDSSPWVAAAFAATHTATVRFDTVLHDSAMIGGAGEYLTRPGFWHGAIGVSAVWAGGLRGLFELHLARWKRRDEHSLAHLASAYAATRATHATLVAAAVEIDADPTEYAVAEARARSVRHTIERLSTTALDDLGVGAGPEPLAHDAAIIERTQQLQLYIRQCHGERDLAPLGRHLLDVRAAAQAGDAIGHGGGPGS